MRLGLSYQKKISLIPDEGRSRGTGFGVTGGGCRVDNAGTPTSVLYARHDPSSTERERYVRDLLQKKKKKKKKKTHEKTEK